MNDNNMMSFSNKDFGNIRTVIIDNEPWFVGKDIAEALGYSNPSKAIIMHVDDDDKIMKMIPQSQNGNLVTQATLINESGLYSLIFSSKLESAKQFKRWVTSEVLPSIRKNGSYHTNKSITSSDMKKLSVVNTTTKVVMKVLDEAGLSKSTKVEVLKEIYGNVGINLPIDTKEVKLIESKKKRAEEMAEIYAEYKSFYGNASEEMIADDIKDIIKMDTTDRAKMIALNLIRGAKDKIEFKFN